MKISQTEALFIKMMSTLLKVAILFSQVLVPIIHAYQNVSVTLDYSYKALEGSVYVSVDGKSAKKVCSEGYDWKTASVVCRQLGHGPPVIVKSVYDGETSDFYSDDFFQCEGRENSLSECQYRSFAYYQYCAYFLEVECLPAESQNFDIRLVKQNPFDDYGTVLVFYNYRWGTICSYDSTLPDLLCKQLGFSGGSIYYGTYGKSEDVYEDPVLEVESCTYWDNSLNECTYSSRGVWDFYCSTVSMQCYTSDSSYEDSGSSESMAAGFSVIFFFLIIACCAGVICCVLCRKKNRQPREPVAMANLTSGTTAPLQPQGPVVHPPPPPYKDVVVGPRSDEPPPPVYHPNMGYPPASAPAYPTAPGLGYPSAPGPAYPSAPGPGYPIAPGPGYPTSSGPGYPPASDSGYPANPGYPPAQVSGYPPASGPGYPSTSGPGYPTAPGSGYPPAPDPGNLPPINSGYVPGSGTGYQSAPPPASVAPTAGGSSRMGQTDDVGLPPVGEQSGPTPSAPPSYAPSSD